jgi:hypothetical protein
MSKDRRDRSCTSGTAPHKTRGPWSRCALGRAKQRVLRRRVSLSIASTRRWNRCHRAHWETNEQTGSLCMTLWRTCEHLPIVYDFATKNSFFYGSFLNSCFQCCARSNRDRGSLSGHRRDLGSTTRQPASASEFIAAKSFTRRGLAHSSPRRACAANTDPGETVPRRGSLTPHPAPDNGARQVQLAYRFAA